jgi:hypothetical protein
MTVDRGLGFIQTRAVSPFPWTPIKIYEDVNVSWGTRMQREDTDGRPCRKLELLHARELVHTHDIHLVSVFISQLIQFPHQLLMIRLYKHTSSPLLSRDIRDNRSSNRPSPDIRSKLRRHDHVIPNRSPPVRAPRQRKRLRRRPLCTGIIVPMHRCRAICEHNAVENKRASHFCAVFPVCGKFHRDAGEGGA